MLIYKFNQNLLPATFLSRINKFLVEVELNQTHVLCHLHDPGRLPGLLVKGQKLLLLEKEGHRKTKYDVIASWADEWVFIRLGYHSLFAEKLFEKQKV